MTDEPDSKLRAAAGRVCDALTKLLADDGLDMANVDEVCCALEEITALAGPTSLPLVKLRRQLEKQGFRKERT